METHKNENKIIEKSNFFEKKFFTPLKLVITRFPLSIAFFAIISALISYLILESNTVDEEIFIRIIASLGITAILSVSVNLLAEKFNKKSLQFLHIATILYGIFVYIYWNLNQDFFVTVLLQIPAFIALVFWVGSKKSEHDEHFYNNFLHIITAVLLGAGVGIIATILGSIAVFSVQNLFDLSYNFSKWAGVWSAICLTFFAPTYALSQFPGKDEHSTKVFEDGGKTGFITKFIFVPFTIIYFVILYAYNAKVLANFSDWPKGMIASLVMGFSILAYFSYILTKSSNSAMIKNFRKFLPFVILPQIFMLFYAIYLRIAQYGLTTNRYLIVISGVILLGLSIYYIASKKKTIIAIPAAFSVFAIIFSFGPWGIHSLPQKLQFESLKNLMIETEMYKNGEFSPYNLEKFGIEKQELIYGKMHYLCSYSACDKDFYNFIEPAIKTYDKPIFPDERKRQGPSYSFFEKMNLIPKTHSSYIYNENGEKQPILAINNPEYINSDAIRVTNFDYYFTLSGYMQSIENVEIKRGEKGIIVKIDNENHEISLENLMKNIQQNNGQNPEKEAFEINFENEKIIAKITIQNLYIINEENPKINDIYGNILIKIK